MSNGFTARNALGKHTDKELLGNFLIICSMAFFPLQHTYNRVKTLQSGSYVTVLPKLDHLILTCLELPESGFISGHDIQRLPT